MSLQLEYIAQTGIPVEVEGLVPNVLQHMSLDEIKSHKIFHGNREIELAEMFTVHGDPTDGHLEWKGDLTGVHWLGAKMVSGSIIVHGKAGRHLGSEMVGGTIEVLGDAGDWVGGEMYGGLIHVRGRAGHLVGAAYRGSRRGMTGGTILIDGHVGNEIGHTMRRGLLAVGGDAGDLVGFNMLAGTILVMGNAGIRHGAGMRRGTIGFLGDQSPELLVSFRYGCQYNPPMLPLIFNELQRLEFDIPTALHKTAYKLYHGDLIEGGRGEIILPIRN